MILPAGARSRLRSAGLVAIATAAVQPMATLGALGGSALLAMLSIALGAAFLGACLVIIATVLTHRSAGRQA